MKKSFSVVTCFTLCLILLGCSTQESVEVADTGLQTQDVVDEPTSPPATESVTLESPGELEPQDCQVLFEKRELNEPYQRYDNQPRFTLSEEELLEYFYLMGIEEICIPSELGAPFINVDWNADDLPATGRMVSIGLEELYHGGGWSSGYLLFSTYDFSLGTEYEVFATIKDLESIQNRSIPNLIDAGGATGFIRYHPSIPMGMQMIMKTYIFPREEYYIAVVINLAAYDPADVDDILLEMEAGSHPDINSEIVLLMDILASSIRFQAQP